MPLAYTQELDLDPGTLISKLDRWLDTALKLVPNLAVAIVVLGLAWFAASFVARMIQRSAKARQRSNLGEILAGLVRWLVVVGGFLIAATIVFPSLKPGDLVAGLGVSSVAIGFAFKDILQNWLAGLLLLIRQPFQIGDQIEVGDYEGTVQHIETRATIVRTYDGQKAVIPNADIYSDAVLVKTGFEKRRSHYDVGIGYGDDIEEARRVIGEVLEQHPDIESDPAPQVLTWDLAASWVTLRARWWTDTRRADVVSVKSDVLQGIKAALDKSRIDMPYETQVHLFHDQTETSDGDRGAQREGWPAPSSGHTEPRWTAQRDEAARRNGEGVEQTSGAS